MIVSQQNLDYAIDILASHTELGLDTETTGLSEDDRLFSLILACNNGPMYFNFITYPGTDLHPDYVLNRSYVFDLLNQRIFSDPTKVYYIHNAKFDMRMLSKEYVELAGTVVCTHAVERVLRNNHFGGEAYSLAACSKRRGWEKDSGVEQYISRNGLYTKMEVPGKKKIVLKPHFDKVPFEIMTTYALKDGDLHLKLGQSQKEALQLLENDLPRGFPSYGLIARNEVKLTKTCFHMERTGILLDVPKTEAALQYEITQANIKKQSFLEKTGFIFTDSNKYLANIFDRMGEPYPRTEKGNPSFTAEALEEMTTPVASIINDIRYHEKRAGTYYSSFLYYKDDNGVIHADIRQGGTETGRMSYRDPNLQNIPKEDFAEDQNLPFQVRECFVPRHGHFLSPLDFEQMEYKVMLDYAGEMKLIERVLAGEDLHQVTADMVGITRKYAKTLNFAILYGAGLEKIAKMLGVTTKEAGELRKLYFGRLPRVHKFIREVISAGEARGYIFNKFGRRCHIAQKDFAYVLPNHLIQGTCADIVKIAMNRIFDMLIEEKAETNMLLQVHDELLFEPTFDEAEIVLDIQKIMENVYEPFNNMKLTTSIEHSRLSWGHRHKVKGLLCA